jgi:hypothetical protein
MTGLIHVHQSVPENRLSILLEHVGWVPTLSCTGLTQLSQKNQTNLNLHSTVVGRRRTQSNPVVKTEVNPISE